jgi:hypothetical protein
MALTEMGREIPDAEGSKLLQTSIGTHSTEMLFVYLQGYISAIADHTSEAFEAATVAEGFFLRI